MKHQNIIHRDLKLSNILLHFPSEDHDKRVSDDFIQSWTPDTPTEVMIADLGFARIVENDMLHSNVGTPKYKAPEMFYN